MSPAGIHPDLGELGPELRKLAQAILDGIDPAVRATAMLATPERPGKCQQVWCPVCALAALVTGEEHPLLTVIAEHSVALLAVIRAALDDSGTPGTPPQGPPGGGGAPAAEAPEAPQASEGPAKGGYQPIPVSIQE